MPNRSLRIAYLINSLGTGGAERQLVYLACAAKAHGLDVSVYSLLSEDNDANYQQRLQAAGIPFITLGVERSRLNPRDVLNVIMALRQSRANVIHSFLFHSNILARISRLLSPRAVLISSIRSTVEGSQTRERLYRITDFLCAVTTQNSIAGAERSITNRAVPAHKMRVIENGVDMARFQPSRDIRHSLRSELEIEAFMVWLCVGRLEPVKNYPLLLDSFQRIQADYPNAHLLIAGDGPLRSELEQQVTRLGNENNVRFLGLRQDIDRLMNVADAFVMASKWEGTANVLLEAGASAVPIVATDVGGTRQVVVDEQTGFLVMPENADDLYKKMAAVMRMTEQARRDMGAAGRAHITAHYSLETSMANWMALYREILNNDSTNQWIVERDER